MFVKFSVNILNELRADVNANAPVLSTEKGDLFLLKNAPFGAIRLKIRIEAFLAFIVNLPEEHRPRFIQVVPNEDKNDDFQIIINGAVEMKEDGLYLEGKRVRIL